MSRRAPAPPDDGSPRTDEGAEERRRFRYRNGAITIATDRAIAEAERARTDGRVDVTVTLERPWREAPPIAREPMGPSRATRHRFAAGRWTSVDRHGSWLDIRPDGTVSAGTRPGFYESAMRAPSAAEYWRVMLAAGIANVLLCAADDEHRVTVHAAAAALWADGPAILLIGASGAGKSTVCAALQRRGCQWAATDATHVLVPAGPTEPWRVAPAWPVGLARGAEGNRWPRLRAIPEPLLRRSAPIEAIYALVAGRPTERSAIGEVFGHLALRCRRSALFRRSLRFAEPCGHPGDEAAAGWETAGPPVWTVERPPGYTADDTAGLVAGHAARSLGATALL